MTFNLFDESQLRDPFTGFSELRERCPVASTAAPGMSPMWIVTRYEDVKLVLGDRRFVNNTANIPGLDVPSLSEQAMRARGLTEEQMRYMLTGILELDGAEHLRLRRLVSRAFTARRVAELRPRVAQLAEDLLDHLAEVAKNSEDGAVDLLEHFAYPLPIIVICELVGIPAEHRLLWRDWSKALIAGDGAAMSSALSGMVTHVQELIELRRAEPADDLISALVREQDEDGDRLSDVEMITLVTTIVVAGHETTSHLIGNGTAALLTHPDQLELLLKDPERTPRAVHELLRWCGPAHLTRMRYATEDVEIAGTVVRKGEAVIAVLSGANRDPRMFDEPDRLDITRATDGRRETHVAFAHGLHYCLGAALARQEGEVAFEALFRRFPGLSLAVAPEALQRVPNPGAWQLAALPVRL